MYHLEVRQADDPGVPMAAPPWVPWGVHVQGQDPGPLQRQVIGRRAAEGSIPSHDDNIVTR